MELKDIFSRFNTGEVAAHSELGTRDEAKQTKNFAARIQRMKTVTGIKAHALVMKDVVIPFNPFTCEVDATYNAKTPFRPILLVSQVITGIKEFAADKPELQEKWNNMLGDDVKVDWSAPATMDDYNAFKAHGFIKPRIMSYSTVALNFGGLSGFPEFKQKYTVDPAELNDSGSYDPEKAPMWHQAAVFFNSILKPEADEVVATLEKKSANKEQIATERRAIFSKSPVGFVTPTNLIPFLFFPVDQVPENMKPEHFTDFEKCMRFYGYNSEKWAAAMEECEKNNLFDENMDWYDFTISTPSSTSTKSNGQVYTDDDSMELYKALAIKNTDARQSVWTGQTATADGKTVSNADAYKSVWEAAAAYFIHSQEQSAIDGGETFERLMAMSNRFRPLTSVLDKFLEACNQRFQTEDFSGSKYFTESVKKANSAFFTAMYPENALALANYDDDELEDAAKEQAANIGNLIAEATSGLENLDFGDDTKLADNG